MSGNEGGASGKTPVRGVSFDHEKADYECRIRGWKTADLATAAGISEKTAWKATTGRGGRVNLATALAISIAFERTRDQIIPEAVAFMGTGPGPEAA